VDQWQGNTAVPIDPYGWQPKVSSQSDPYSILHPGFVNQLLWAH
jgi:hypothetical protein